MTQTTNRFFDEIARLMNDAAGVASGVRREFDTMMRNQAERILRDLDVVKREEFEAVQGHGAARARGERGAEGPDRRARGQARLRRAPKLDTAIARLPGPYGVALFSPSRPLKRAERRARRSTPRGSRLRSRRPDHLLVMSGVHCR